MIKKIFYYLFLFFIVTDLKAQMKPEETEDWSRKPPVVTPGKLNQPPSECNCSLQWSKGYYKLD